jgi:hypothetical protein
MMAGWIIRVVTVTHGARYLRLASYVPPVYVRTRGPLMSDAMPKVPLKLPPPFPGISAGCCGSVARRPCAGVWARAVSDLAYYVARWGSNPLGARARISGARGAQSNRGPQDYLFQRKGAGDE